MPAMKEVASQVVSFAALCNTFFDQGAQAMSAFCHSVAELSEKHGLTASHCAAVVSTYDWAENVRDTRKLARIARAICDAKASQRAARIAAILTPASNRSYATLGSCEAVCVEHDWGIAQSGKGAGGGRTKGATQTKETKESEAVQGLRKLTVSKLIEYVAQRAAKNPDFRAKLLAALNAETADAE